MGAFFQELTPEIKVTVDENSERHSMTTAYTHKLNLGGNMAYNTIHALTGLADLEKSGLGPRKKVPFVLELSWNFVKSSLKL